MSQETGRRGRLRADNSVQQTALRAPDEAERQAFWP